MTLNLRELRLFWNFPFMYLFLQITLFCSIFVPLLLFFAVTITFDSFVVFQCSRANHLQENYNLSSKWIQSLYYRRAHCMIFVCTKPSESFQCDNCDKSLGVFIVIWDSFWGNSMLYLVSSMNKLLFKCF